MLILIVFTHKNIFFIEIKNTRRSPGGFYKKKRRGNCFNFLSVSRYRQTPTIQIIIDSPRLNGYTYPLGCIYERGERFLSITLEWFRKLAIFETRIILLKTLFEFNICISLFKKGLRHRWYKHNYFFYIYNNLCRFLFRE